MAIEAAMMPVPGSAVAQIVALIDSAVTVLVDSVKCEKRVRAYC